MTKVLNTEQLAASQLAMDVESKPEEEHYDMAIKPETQQTATLAGISEELQWAASLSDEELKAAQKKLVRKIDLRLMPMLWCLIVLNYLDRNALASARVQGIEKDLHMQGNDFNVAISVLFVGYILGQIPSNLILAHPGVRPSLYISAWVALWGVVSACTAAANSYGHLVAIRFILGIVESPYFPGALFLLSSWYTKKELAFRMSIMYSGSLLSGAFGGLISAGIQANLNHARGLAAWRWMFIIEGSITVLFAILTAFSIPDYPATTKWLSSKEKAIAVYRLQVDSGTHTADEDPQTFMSALKTACIDYKMWLLALIQVTKTTAAAVTSFVPTVVNTFGYSKVHTLLLTAPPYVFATIGCLAISFSSDRRPERAFHLAVPVVFAMIGNIISATTSSVAPRYFALFLLLGGIYAPFNVNYAWLSSCFPRPRAKRAAVYALVNGIANLAQVWSPYMYDKAYGPRYSIAFGVNSGMCFIAICTAFLLRWCLKRENKKLSQAGGDAGFRYML